MPDSPNPILASIQRTLRLLVIATVVLYLLLFALVGYIYLETTATNGALCTFRAQLESQVMASNRFLIEHPQGIAGISAQTIREGVQRQELAISSLNSLSC